MTQRRTSTDDEQTGACRSNVPPRSRSKRICSSPSKPVLGRRKGRRMGELPHARDANPSEADDEDGWAKSSTPEADWYVHNAVTSPTAVKRPSSHSASSAVLTSEHDRTPQANRLFQLHLGASERSHLLTDQSQGPTVALLDKTLVTPRATVSGTNRGTRDVTRIRSSRSSGSALTDGGCAQEGRTNICEGSPELRKDLCDRSSAEVEYMHDPRKFYASDSPVFNNSDSDQELYKSAEESLGPEDQGDEQVGGHSVGLHSGSSQSLQGLSAQPRSLGPQPFWSPSSQAMLPSCPLSQPVLFRDQPRVTQRHDILLENHSNADDVRQGSHSPVIGLHQTLESQNCNPRGVGHRGQKARRRSPRRRGSEEKALSKLVRDELASLLTAKSPYGRTPEPSQLVAFTAEWERSGHGAKACNATTTDFMIDIAGAPKSPWNISAGRVFTSYVIEKMGFDDVEETRTAIEKAFYTRFKSLKTRHGKDGLSQAERAAEKSKHSRYQRKYQIFQRRREIAKQYGPLLRHLEVLDALGIDGMSSDESDMDPTTNQRKYTVVKPDWRHPDLHHWLGMFDQFHHYGHLNSLPNDRRGAFAHIRVASQKVHNGVHPPPHLPVNAYDQQWLEGRETMYVKYVLRPKAEPYDFSHPLALIQLLNGR